MHDIEIADPFAPFYNVKPGTVSVFIPDEPDQIDRRLLDRAYRIVSMMGIRTQVNVEPISDPHLWNFMVVKRVSLIDDFHRFAAVYLPCVDYEKDAAQYLSTLLRDVIPENRDFESFYRDISGKPSGDFDMPSPTNLYDDDLSSAFLDNCDRVPGIFDAKTECSKSNYSREPLLSFAHSTQKVGNSYGSSVDLEQSEELALEKEKDEWIARLSDLVLQYVTRFNEIPPMEWINNELRGRLVLRTSAPSPITVNGDMHIFLPAFNETELRMTPLARTVYILFLCHPEGIRLKNIPDYADELSEIYSMVRPGISDESARLSIADLVDPFGDSLQQKLSMTRKAVRRQILDTGMAERYIIKGERGGLFRIGIDPGLINLPEILTRHA